MTKKPLEGKKIAIIVAFRDYRDVEYFIPRDILINAGAKVVTVSTEPGIAIGTEGGEAKIDLTLDYLGKMDIFDGIVFIGGPGAVRYLDNERSYKIAQKTVEVDKVLAAICISPSILAKAGVLKGKKATVWSAPLDKSAIMILEDNGAIFKEQAVVVDGKIVTAKGPSAAKEFGQSLVKVLTP